MKKFIYSILAIVMLVLLNIIPVFADDPPNPGSITITNPTDGSGNPDVTYYAYKIFDLTYSGEHYSYTIKESSQWYTPVKEYADDTSHNMTLTQAYYDNTVYIVTTPETGFGAADFAAYLRTWYIDQTVAPMGDEFQKIDGTVKADNLELGYYLILGIEDSDHTKAEALANLTSTNPTATIMQKSTINFDKLDDKDDIEIGETVNYTILGEVPNTDGFSQYTYKIQDTLSEGLTLNKESISVYVGDQSLADDKYTLDKTDTGFTLIIKVKELQDVKGEQIKVTYNATVNSQAVAVISKNEAKLTYSNNPTDSSSTKVLDDEEKVFSSKITLYKYAINTTNENDKTTALPGAVFILSKTEGEKTLYYKEDASGNVSWVEDKTQATEKTTNAFGNAEFLGLKNGTYNIIETKAPDGYNQLIGSPSVTINGNDSDSHSLTYAIDVGNGTGLQLPNTGASGTKPLIYGGAALITASAAAALYYIKKS